MKTGLRTFVGGFFAVRNVSLNSFTNAARGAAARRPTRMRPYCFWIIALLGLCLAVSGSRALDPTRKTSAPADATKKLDATRLAARIDQLIAAEWSKRGISPAPLADDGIYLRRVYLDIIGHIPRVSEVREFLDDKSPDKRSKVVERLLNHAQYVEHFTNTWRHLIAPQNNDFQALFAARNFETWLRDQIRRDAPYDKMVRDLLTVPMQGNGNRNVFQPVNGNLQAAALAFYQLNENKQENLAASTSRLFMGVKLECAQCHDHPFAKWSRKQFWELAAFFPTPRRPLGANQNFPPQGFTESRQIRIPGTDKVVKARFLDDTEPQFKDGISTRVPLAEWLTSPANPFFARNAVNRMWAHFFGIGIMDPVDDDPTEENPVSHPALLDELSRQFVAHNYDMKYLIRAITNSRTYQLSGTATNPSQEDPRAFAKAAIKGLSPEQLFESLITATGSRLRRNPNDVFNQGGPANQILIRFANQDKRTEYQTSILQALMLMNGQFVNDAASAKRSILLAAVADAPFLDTEQRVETLFLATVSRRPTAEESARLSAHVRGSNDRDAALGDVFWALLNSSEFFLNH
jgi:hypothetical protein